MSEKNLDTLIEHLSADWQPVKRLPHPLLHMLPWIIVAAAYLVAVVFFLGVRSNIEIKLAQSGYIFEIALTAMIAISAALASSWLSIPDVRNQKWVMAIPVSLLGVFFLYTAAGIYTGGFIMPPVVLHSCIKDALLFGMAPVFMLILLCCRGATTHPLQMMGMNVLSVGALGWLGLRITCASDAAGHMLTYHFMPFVILGAVFGLLARRLYRW